MLLFVIASLRVFRVRVPDPWVVVPDGEESLDAPAAA